MFPVGLFCLFVSPDNKGHPQPRRSSYENSRQSSSRPSTSCIKDTLHPVVSAISSSQATTKQSQPTQLKSGQYSQVSFSTNTSTNTTMPFFKSSSASAKNQTASAATTPVQTPRSSMQATRPKKEQSTMTVDQALEMAMKKASYASHAQSVFLPVL